MSGEDPAHTLGEFIKWILRRIIKPLTCQKNNPKVLRRMTKAHLRSGVKRIVRKVNNDEDLLNMPRPLICTPTLI
jgi:hypothetical protein